MKFLVLHKTIAFLKKFPTFFALERFLPSVRSLVSNKPRFVNECFPTIATYMTLFCTMSFVVFVGRVSLATGFPILVTLRRPSCSSVNLPVFKQITAVCEKFPTFITCTTLFGCMSSQVPNKSWFASEGFPTVITLIRSFSSVDSAVFGKVGNLPEGFSTLITHIGFFSRVDSVVFYEGISLGKWFSTLSTFIGLFTRVDSEVVI